MDCPTEEGLLRKKLGGVAGVTSLEFNLMQRVLTVTHAPQVAARANGEPDDEWLRK